MEYCLDYALRDHEVVDYGSYRPEELPGAIMRGPSIDYSNEKEFFSAIGAAQTYGVYSDVAFPQLLTQQLGIKSLNLGVGAAGPGFFLLHPEFFDVVNRGKFAIVQIMAARGESNSRMETQPVPYLVKDLKHGDIVGANTFWGRALAEEPDKFDDYVRESQESFVANMRAVAARLSVPIIYFWFSPKALDAQITLDTSVIGLMDTYPQFVTQDTLSFIEADNPLVVCHSDRQMRFPLLSRFTGKQVEVDYQDCNKSDTVVEFTENENVYYPSPQMQWDAAIVLGEEIRKRGLV